MNRQEAELFAGKYKSKLWRVFGNWLVFEMNIRKTINFVYVGNYRTNYGMAFLTNTGQFVYPNDDAVIPPKAMLQAMENKLRREA